MNNFEAEQVIRYAASAVGMDQKSYEQFFHTMVSLYLNKDRECKEEIIALSGLGIPAVHVLWINGKTTSTVKGHEAYQYLIEFFDKNYNGWKGVTIDDLRRELAIAHGTLSEIHRASEVARRNVDDPAALINFVYIASQDAVRKCRDLSSPYNMNFLNRSPRAWDKNTLEIIEALEYILSTSRTACMNMKDNAHWYIQERAQKALELIQPDQAPDATQG